MPSALLTPGVYVEEIPSGVRTIIGVSTATTAFVGRAKRGPVDDARVITGPGDFERTFGGLWSESRLGYSVNDFFRNGGRQAVIVRVNNAPGRVKSAAEAADVKSGAGAVQQAVDAAANTAGATVDTVAQAAADFPIPASATSGYAMGAKAAKDAVKQAHDEQGADIPKVQAAAQKAASDDPMLDRALFNVGDLQLEASSPGSWGADLRARVNNQGLKKRNENLPAGSDKLFNLVVTDAATNASETFSAIVLQTGDRTIKDVLKTQSELVRFSGGKAPPATKDPWDASEGPSEIETRTKQLAADVTGGNDPKPGVDALRDELKKWADEVTAADQALGALLTAITTASRAPGANPAAIAAATDAANKDAQAEVDKAKKARSDAASDGEAISALSIIPTDGPSEFTGIYALEKTDIFNLLVIPPYLNLDAGEGGDVDAGVINDAAVFCEAKRAMLIVDPPTGWKTPDDVTKGLVATDDPVGTRSKNAAIFFPRIRQPNPLNEMRPETFTPSGTVAGVMARTDVERGVWKAPAGLDAVLKGVSKLASDLTNGENGELNPRAVNCLRLMPTGRRVVWGSRTLEGDDRLASEWKYIPIRRTALFIEESLYRGTQWVVFEPNDEPLWASIRLNVGAFLNGLFRQGAFAGRTPAQAYFVRCDKDTNPQNDIDRGIVNILVGFAPLKPAEFVVIKLQQIAGQLEV